MIKDEVDDGFDEQFSGWEAAGLYSPERRSTAPCSPVTACHGHKVNSITSYFISFNLRCSGIFIVYVFQGVFLFDAHIAALIWTGHNNRASSCTYGAFVWM